MRIGELAERAGVTPRTIRYYESLHLLGPCQREGDGFRYYTDAALCRLQKIDALKQLGLGLDDIASVIDLYFADGRLLEGKQRLLQILRRHLAETDERLTHLRQFRGELAEKITGLEEYLASADGETTGAAPEPMPMPMPMPRSTTAR